MMTKSLSLNLKSIDPSWHECIQTGLRQMDQDYLEKLTQNTDWLPGQDKIFNAFSLPMDKIRYVLIGESPYPRAQSANGFAFWDQAVDQIWSAKGLSKQVNRATSLRNIIKMLLVAENALSPDNTSQEAIALLDKNAFISTNSELFQHLINAGFLLLNASLVLQPTAVRKDAAAWKPFIKSVLTYLFQNNPNVTLILLGNIANEIDALVDHFEIKRLYAEHPYNLSFIQNTQVLDFFRPLHLLLKTP